MSTASVINSSRIVPPDSPFLEGGVLRVVVFLRGAVLALPALRVLFPLGAEAVREGVALPVPLAVFGSLRLLLGQQGGCFLSIVRLFVRYRFCLSAFLPLVSFWVRSS